MAKKYKDNIIQFPTKHKPSDKAKLQMLETRMAEIEIENDMMRSDMDYLSGAINKNVSELQDILKEMSLLAGLEKPIVEFKGESNDLKDLEIEFNFDQLNNLFNNPDDDEDK
tara:strand:- start:213 stop:548 length:336 start_codon:yes stop_codon:yes gene_type:complete